MIGIGDHCISLEMEADRARCALESGLLSCALLKTANSRLNLFTVSKLLPLTTFTDSPCSSTAENPASSFR